MHEKRWSVEISKFCLKALKRIPGPDSSRILERLEEFENLENPLLYKDVRRLEGKLQAFYRLRVGEYRVIFEVDRDQGRIGILAIITRGKGY